MRFMHSLRWRIQLWHGALLVAVLGVLGVAAFRYQRASAGERMDRELRNRVSVLFEALPRRGPPRPPPPPRDRRGEGEPPPRPPDFRLEPADAALFGMKDGSGFYYVLWRRDGAELARSPDGPKDVSLPERLPTGRGGPSERTRGKWREAYAFTPPGECILVGCSTEFEEAALAAYARWLAAIGGAVMLAGLGGGWWITSRAIRPIGAITATAERIAEGHLDERIDAHGSGSELGQLADVLNSTFARLEASFARQAQFTADAAHELRTPVSIVLSQAQLGLRGDRSTADYREMLEACLRAARRMEKLTHSLLALARQDADATPLRLEPCDLAVVAGEGLELIEPLARERHVALLRELSTAPCRADADQIAQVLLNLLTNALEHTPTGGSITVRTGSEAGEARLAILDTGSGIAAEHLPRLCDRFYRPDQSRNRRTGGAGLGLAICKSIADAHHGRLLIASREGEGSTFTLCLPVR